jgi:formylglycine-generating enzyme required for sulfatase activity
MHTARDKLRELRTLHEDGLLSLQEFDSRKNAILDAEYAPPLRAPFAAQARAGTEIGLMPGQELGPPNRRYRLEHLIAQGGMGQVWRATDLATHAELGHSATVALKILPPRLTQNAGHARLLVEEATQARRLAHEHIVRVYEWAQDPATASYFIIMECLEGEDLDSLLARTGPFSLARVDQLLGPIGRALGYAWERHQLVHRDIKPGNVFVTQQGDVKLLDFGIAARAREGDNVIGIEAPASSGTAGYRAPEAGIGHSTPGQALDVYAVAVMIYQMVDGRMPFEGARSASQVPARPRALTLPQWEVLRSGFDWLPTARPPSVAALLEALRRASKPAANQQAAHSATDTAQLRQAGAEAQALMERQRRQHEALERERSEQARRARKQELLLQLRARRAADAERTRRELDQQQLAAQAKAAAAYRSEQQRARKAQSVRSASQLASRVASLDGPGADADGVLRDPFLRGAGKGPELVLIPTGRFQMGSPKHERDKAIEAGSQASWLERETPRHWVGIEQSFALGRYPVTVGEWRQFVHASGWQSAASNWDAPGFVQTDEHPVVGVSWEDAQRYVAWLSAQSGQPYRLPSEAEWEYGCRAGTVSAFSFGDTISPALASYDARSSYNGSPTGARQHGSSPVGDYPANPWGLFDMHGNVWEWVQDVVHDSYEGAPATGRAWEQGGDPRRRILRGGAWLYAPRFLRSALRNGFVATQGNDIIGFRVARDLL